MESGVYGKADVSASTWTTLVPAPTAGTKVCTVNLVNRTAANVKVRIAIAASTTVADADNIEYDVSLPANGVLERTGIVLDTSNGIQVYANAAGVSAVSFGIDGN